MTDTRPETPHAPPHDKWALMFDLDNIWNSTAAAGDVKEGYERLRVFCEQQGSDAEQLLADLNFIWESVEDSRESNEAYARLKNALTGSGTSRQKHPVQVGMADVGAIRVVIEELRRRMVGPPMPKPVQGYELLDWQRRLEAAIEGHEEDSTEEACEASAREYHVGDIRRLGQNEVFVFGSNEAGVHGAGAAKFARQAFGAQQGVGSGPTGRCYALPTKDRMIQTLPLERIRRHVEAFLDYARSRPDQRFLLTAVGCGLAGYKASEIAPLFEGAPANVVFPPEFS